MQKKKCGETMAENFFKFERDINLYIQEVNIKQNKLKENNTRTHYNQTTEN